MKGYKLLYETQYDNDNAESMMLLSEIITIYML